MDSIVSTWYKSRSEDICRVFTTSTPQTDSEVTRRGYIRWRHLKTENITFETFMDAALRITSFHHPELDYLAVDILSRVQERYKAQLAGAPCVPPGTVICGNAVDSDNPGSENSLALFVAFSYLDTTNVRPRSISTQSLHTPSSLLQFAYNHDSGSDQQIYSQIVHDPSRYLRVSHQWVLILDSSLIISCGPSDWSELFSPSIQLVPEDTSVSHRAYLVQIMDFYKRLIYIPVDRCGTYYELLNVIEKDCLSDTESTIRDCQIFVSGQEELTANQWIDLIRSENMPYISLQLILRDTKRWTSSRLASQTPVSEHDMEAPDPTSNWASTVNENLLAHSADSHLVARSGIRDGVPYEEIELRVPEKREIDGTGATGLESKNWSSNQNDHIDTGVTQKSFGNTPKEGKPEGNAQGLWKTIKPLHENIREPYGHRGLENEARISMDPDSPDWVPGSNDKAALGPHGNFPITQEEFKLQGGLRPGLTLDLTVPAFLSWPADLLDIDIPNPTQADILKHVEARLNTKGTLLDQLPVAQDHPFIFYFQNGHAFRNGNLVTLQQAHSQLDMLKKTIMLFSNIESADQGEGQPQNTTTRSESATPELKVMGTVMEGILKNTEQLLDFFVSKYYTHGLLLMCWGSLVDMMLMIVGLCVEAYQEIQLDENRGLDEKFLVLCPTSIEIAGDDISENLRHSIKLCPSCHDSTIYVHQDDALQHLRQHLSSIIKDTDIQEAERIPELKKGWLKSVKAIATERKIKEITLLLIAFLTRIRKLRSQATHIRRAVANESNSKAPQYLLSPSLVKSLEQILKLIFTINICMRVVDDIFKTWEPWCDDDPEEITCSKLKSNHDILRYFGQEAQIELLNAQEELILSAKEGINEQEDCESKIIGPEHIVLFSLRNIGVKTSIANSNVLDVYNSYLLELKLQATQAPSKRIFRELHYLREELEIIKLVAKSQEKAFMSLRRALNRTSRASGIIRANIYDKIELPALRGITTKLAQWKAQYQNMQKEYSEIDRVLRYNIEILEEGQSKAILLFTTITIIFLPLSAVASILGMNTIDVRNTNQSQSLFWEIVIPLTSFIGLLCLAVIYGGSTLEGLGNSAAYAYHRMVKASRKKDNLPQWSWSGSKDAGTELLSEHGSSSGRSKTSVSRSALGLGGVRKRMAARSKQNSSRPTGL